MNDRELLPRGRRNVDARRRFGKSLRGEKRERQMRHGRAKLGPRRAIPGVNFVERCERFAFRVVDHADQFEPGVSDGARAVGKTDQGKNYARSPDFGVISPRSLQRRQRKNHIADSARADQEMSHTLKHYWLFPHFVFGRPMLSACGCSLGSQNGPDLRMFW